MSYTPPLPEQPPPVFASAMQLYLLDEVDLPVAPKVVEGAKRWVHTGRTTCRDEEMAVEIAELVLRGVSDRAIGRHLRVSRNTVRAVMDVLEADGKLEPLKRRLSRKLGVLVERCLDEYDRQLALGKIPGATVALHSAIFATKKGELDQDPELTGRPVVAQISAQDLHARIADARRRLGVSPDSQSGGQATQPVAIEGTIILDTALDTRSGILVPIEPGPEPLPAAGPQPIEAPPEGGGGGQAAAGGASNDVPSRPGLPVPK